MEALTNDQRSEMEDIFNKVAITTGTGDENVKVISAKEVRRKGRGFSVYIGFSLSLRCSSRS